MPEPYKIGDVVNGHVLTATGWVPLGHASLTAPTVTPYVAPPRKGNKGKILGIAAIVFLLFVVIPVIYTAGQASNKANPAAPLASVSLSTPTPTPFPNPTEEPVATPEPAAEPTPSQDSIIEPEPSGLGKVGETYVLDNWTVTVTAINKNADAIIAEANMFNDPAEGQWVLVTYKATYTGTERTADAFWDLTWSFTDTAQVVHDEGSAVTPKDNAEAPSETRKGGTVTGDLVFDIPHGKVIGGILSVEELFGDTYAEYEVK